MAAPTRAEVDQLLRQRLSTDPDFRDALIADPRAALSDLVGITIPASVKVNVHAESLTEIHLVLPRDPNASGELQEDDLAAVTGGIDGSQPLMDIYL